MYKTIKDRIIKDGVKTLREYGYTDVTKENILTDIVYMELFEELLIEHLGIGYDKEINSILADLKASK